MSFVPTMRQTATPTTKTRRAPAKARAKPKTTPAIDPSSLPDSPPLHSPVEPYTPSEETSLTDTSTVTHEDILHVTDLFSLIVAFLPVRHRWRLAILDKGTYRAYQARYTHQYKVKGCGVELFFAPHEVTIKSNETVEVGRDRAITQRRTMHKTELIEHILRFETPGISLLAPPSYGKTLMAAILAFQYRGNGNRADTYKLGDEITPSDRVWLIVPNKCIENQLAELEKAYPGCIKWDDPYHSPVVVTQSLPTAKSASTGKPRGKDMVAYALNRLPLHIIVEMTQGAHSTRQLPTRSDWLDSPRYTTRDDDKHLNEELSPYNKVVVIGHSLFQGCDGRYLGMPIGSYYIHYVWPTMCDGLMIIDEAHMRITTTSYLLKRPEARPGGHVIALSATKHGAVKMSTDVTCYTVASQMMVEEKPLYTIRQQYYPSYEAMVDTLDAAIASGAKRIVYAISNRVAKQVTIASNHLLERYPKSISRGKETSSVRIILANGKSVATSIDTFNAPDEPGTSTVRILVAGVTTIGVGLNIHADWVLVASHPNCLDRSSEIPGGRKTKTDSWVNGVPSITPPALHQLVGRFVRIHNHNEVIPITVAYHGPWRMDPAEHQVDELALRVIIAAFRLRQENDSNNVLTELWHRCAAIIHLIPDVAAMDDATLLYHLYPACKAYKHLYADLPCYSEALSKWLKKAFGQWIHTIEIGFAPEDLTNDDPLPEECNERPEELARHLAIDRRNLYIRDPPGAYRLPRTRGEACRAIVQHIEQLKVEYIELMEAGQLATKPTKRGRKKVV